MNYLLSALSWFFGILFGLFSLSMFLMGNWLQGIVLLGITLLMLPPVRAWLPHLAGRTIPWWVWAISVVVLFAAFIWLGSLNKRTSIYNSPEVEAKFLEIYDAKMEAWPVPYESLFVETGYGPVHIIASGPEDAPPLLLLHASGVAGWSWLYNVADLNKQFRTYAIDTIGDAGKSVLRNVEHYPQDGPAQAALLTEITNQLGIERAYVVGASEGGFIGTNYALYAPERVDKLVLLGPMGYAGTDASILRIVLTQFFPLKPLQASTARWAFGEDPRIQADFAEWFQLLLTQTFPQKARPTQFTAEQRQSLEIPVLLILGTRDNLVGDPEKARALVQDMPDIQVEVLDTGHLIGAEQPHQANALIIPFLNE